MKRISSLFFVLIGSLFSLVSFRPLDAVSIENNLGLNRNSTDPQLVLKLDLIQTGNCNPDCKPRKPTEAEAVPVPLNQRGQKNGVRQIPTDVPDGGFTVWNVYDTEKPNPNFYGTFTVLSNAKDNLVTQPNLQFDSHYYKPPVPNIGYFLTVPENDQSLQPLTKNDLNNAYSITVDRINIHTPLGPFPDAPIASPATYSNGERIVLSVEGNKIMINKPSGKEVAIIKGMVRPSLEWAKQGQFLSVKDIENIHNWGIDGSCNAIRLDMYQEFWLGSADKKTKGSYKQIIDAIVYYAIQNHMAIILDLHWTEFGHQNPMANSRSLDFWREVANEYKDFGTVMFELFNEPFLGSPPDGTSIADVQKIWLKGGLGAGGKFYVGYNQLYAAVRSKAPNNICIVNGLDYGYDLSFVGVIEGQVLVTGPNGAKATNIVYGSHPYNEKGITQTPLLATNFQGLLNHYPLLWTEFGINENKYFLCKNLEPCGSPNCDCDYLRIYSTLLSFINEHKISYTGFAWWVNCYNANNPNVPEYIPAGANTFPDLIVNSTDPDKRDGICKMTDQGWPQMGIPFNGGVLIQHDMISNPGTKIQD